MKPIDWARWILLVPVLASVSGCSERGGPAETSGQFAGAPVPVQVATATQRDVPVQIQAIARVEPCAMVTVRPQVAGKIVAVHFAEGQEVNVGDLLFDMDARPYEATLKQMEAILAKDTALWEDARREAAWRTELHEQGVATQREYDSALAAAASLEAAVRADQAAVELARVDVEYCSVRAALSGRTGEVLVDPGNVVKANEASLVVIHQIKPVYVAFSVPEQYLSEIKRYQGDGRLTVEVAIPADDGPPEHGELTFIDNQVDRTTGMIALRGTFQNESRRLWPGQFVNAVLTLRMLQGAIVIPTQALQMGQTGPYVYVAKPDQTAEMRPVTTGAAVEDHTVIESGIEAGETVVTDGQLRLVQGARVNLKQAAAASQEAGS